MQDVGKVKPDVYEHVLRPRRACDCPFAFCILTCRSWSCALLQRLSLTILVRIILVILHSAQEDCARPQPQLERPSFSVRGVSGTPSQE